MKYLRTQVLKIQKIYLGKKYGKQMSDSVNKRHRKGKACAVDGTSEEFHAVRAYISRGKKKEMILKEHRVSSWKAYI